MMASARGYFNRNLELKTGPEEKNETYIVDFYLSPISKTGRYRQSSTISIKRLRPVIKQKALDDDQDAER